MPGARERTHRNIPYPCQHETRRSARRSPDALSSGTSKVRQGARLSSPGRRTPGALRRRYRGPPRRCSSGLPSRPWTRPYPDLVEPAILLLTDAPPLQGASPARTRRASFTRPPWSRGRPRRSRPRSRQAIRPVSVRLDARCASLPAPSPRDRRSRGVARSRVPARAGEAARSSAFRLASRPASSPALSAPQSAGDRAPATAVERTCGRTVQPGTHAAKLPRSTANCLPAGPLQPRTGSDSSEHARSTASRPFWDSEQAHPPASGLRAPASGLTSSRAGPLSRRAAPVSGERARALASSVGVRRAGSRSCQQPRCPASRRDVLRAGSTSCAACATSCEQARRPAQRARRPASRLDVLRSVRDVLRACSASCEPLRKRASRPGVGRARSLDGEHARAAGDQARSPASRPGARRRGPEPGELLGPSASALFELRARPPSGAPAQRGASALSVERACSNSVASALESRGAIRVPKLRVDRSPRRSFSPPAPSSLPRSGSRWRG